MLAKSQDQHAHVINNTTLKPTDVTDALMVNSQEMELDSKTKDAEFSNKPVMLMVKSNSANNNAMHAKDVPVSTKSSKTTDALSQDQLADASRLLTAATNAKHAQLDNWLTLPTQDVSLRPTPVTLETKFWEINSTAMLA
jgi:hypothetical protein